MTISATTQGIKPGVCTSTNRPSAPFDGQVIYMTDVDQTAVWDGTQWTVLAPIAGGRNVIINGAMQVHQRGTSAVSVNGTGYHSADRFQMVAATAGTYTQTVENDAPTGSGLRKSLKMLVTTANASLSAGSVNYFTQELEGQNVQQFLKGTSSAKQFAVSFWVKSNVTGTYICELFDRDNTRQVSSAYTISSSATWEKKTIIFPADTTGVFDNDNASSMFLGFWLVAGTTYSSGTLQTTWVANTTANRAVGQTNLAAATNNYWQITGVQLEAGAVATPFEFEDAQVTLAKCQRYYCLHPLVSTDMSVASGVLMMTTICHPVTMRAAPTITQTGSTIFNLNAASTFSTDPALFTPQSTTVFVTSTAAARCYLHRPVQLSAEL